MTAKEYIETHIELIDNENYKEFFETLPCDIFIETYNILRNANIKFEYITDFYIGYEENNEPEYLSPEESLEDAINSALNFIQNYPEIKEIYVGITYRDLVWEASISKFILDSSGKGHRDITCKDGSIFRAYYDDEFSDSINCEKIREL